MTPTNACRRSKRLVFIHNLDIKADEQTHQSFGDDGSRRRPGEDFDLTWSVNQDVPGERHLLIHTLLKNIKGNFNQDQLLRCE